MKASLCTLLIVVFALSLAATSAEAGRFKKCDCVIPYTPAPGVKKRCTKRKKTEWVQRYKCLPCGRRIPYKVKVITYVDHFSDGTKRIWQCDVVGSEIGLRRSWK